MMYRLLKDLINWKCNFHIKCKLGKFRYTTLSNSSSATVAATTCLLLLVVSVNLVNCSTNLVNSLNSVNSRKERTLSEHGLFRHDNKYYETTSSPFPLPTSEVSGSSSSGNINSNLNLNHNNNNDRNRDRDHHLHRPQSSISPPDNRDKYTYDSRYKRSVTSVNFHPNKSNNNNDASSSSSSTSTGVKSLRVFKYITEDDVNSDQPHHETVFNSYMSKNESDHSSSNNTEPNHSTRVVGGAKVNLKAKFDKGNKDSGVDKEKLKKSNQVIKNENNNNKNKKEVINQNESKATQSHSSKSYITPTPSKPENIHIFKPTLALRKTSISNKSSLIPSGKYSKLSTQHHLYSQNGASNGITAAVSTKQQQQQPKNPQNEKEEAEEHEHDDHEKELKEEESTDPNSSTVNDRSLIHNFFDSVVVLNEEEGQKELLRQGAGAYHREKTSNSEDVIDNGVGSGGDDDNDDDDDDDDDDHADEIKGAMHAPTPLENHEKTSSSNFGKERNANKEDGEEEELEKEERLVQKGKNSTKSVTNSTNIVIQRMVNKSNGSNKDKMLVVVKKSKSGSSNNNKKGKINKGLLAEDDVAQDGSERSRRSMPFGVTLSNNNNRFPPKPQLHQSRVNRVVQRRNPEQLAREALFRRNTVMTMMAPKMRQLSGPAMTKKIAVVPRVITPGMKSPLMARTILPMKPIPVMHTIKKPRGPPKLAIIPTAGGPLGPGPVGPPIAAIKVMPTANSRNVFLPAPMPLTGSSPMITNPSAPPLPVLPSTGKDLMADASRTLFNYRPLPGSSSAILNQAASSHYSPTFERFRKGFPGKVSKEIEDSIINQWEESRAPSSRRYPPHHRSHHRHHNHHHEPRPRSRSNGRQRNHRHPHSFDRRPRPEPRPRSTHRTGAHSQHPHHHQPHLPRGKKLHGPKYTYPKNAENIQDILSYFDKEVPTPHARARDHPMERTGPASQKQQRQHSQHSSHPQSNNAFNSHSEGFPGPAYPKLADLSGEFRDVHASLLKDIKEFAKRPHMFGSSSHRRDSFRRESFESNVDPLEDLFNPKPLPVRDLVKPHGGGGSGYDKHQGGYDVRPGEYSLENIRERIAFKRGKLNGRHRDKDHERNRDRDEFKDQFDFFGGGDSPPHTEPENESYSSQRGEGLNTNSEDIEQLQKAMFSSREDYDNPSSYTKIGKYKDSSDDSLYPTSHYKDSHSRHDHHNHDSAEFSKTTSHQTQNAAPRKPIVIKRPSSSNSDTFRVTKEEMKKLTGHDYYYNTFTKKFEKSPTTTNLDSPLVLKSPQTHHQPQQQHQPATILQPLSYQAFQAAATHAMTKPVSVEEDIVEIHTGNPSITAASGLPAFAAEAHLKQEKLKKMYMDILQQKMQLEAALLQPQSHMPAVLHQPHTLSTMHAAASYQPQHTQISLAPHLAHHHLGLASHIPAFSPSTTVTLPPLTGLGLTAPRRKKPMRMKIHIYPNGNDDGIQQGLEAANLLAAGGLGFGASGFSASNPPPSVVAPPSMSKDIERKMSESAIPSGPTGPHITSPSGFGASAPSAPMPGTVGSAVKNKNVVLHLHVHRRNDGLGPLELETEGSHPIEATAKAPPQLTHKQIYDEQLKDQHNHHHHHHNRGGEANLQNHRMMVSDGAEEEEENERHRSLLTMSASSTQEMHQEPPHQHQHHEEEEDSERDKSISMEAPIHDEKIDDVFHSIMKLRNKPSKGSGMIVDCGDLGCDKRKKRNRN